MPAYVHPCLDSSSKLSIFSCDAMAGLPQRRAAGLQMKNCMGCQLGLCINAQARFRWATVQLHLHNMLLPRLTEAQCTPADALARKGNGSQATACFYGAVHAAATSATYADAVRNTAAAGGENCGRAQLVGPWLRRCLRAWGNKVGSVQDLW